MNFLEDTFFHHGFVVQSIEEPRDQSPCLVPGAVENQGTWLCQQHQLLCWESQSRFAAQGGGKELRGNARSRAGTGRVKNLEHGSERVGEKKRRWWRKETEFSWWGRNGKRLCMPFPGLSEVPLQHNQTKQQQKELNHLWSDFLGARNLPPD